MTTLLNSPKVKMRIHAKSQRQPQLLVALCLSLTMLVTSCSKQDAAQSASAPPNEPVKAKPFEGQIFRTADDRQAITLISQDELEMRGGDAGPDNLICKYTKQDDTLRVVKTMLGTTLAVYYKITPEGLKANDGTVLLNPAKFLVAQARIKEEEITQRASSLLGSGNKKQDMGDYDGAIADYNRAIELNPKYVFAYNNRGNAKSSKGDLDGAMADFDRALKLDPKYAFAYNNRGTAKGRKGDHVSAMADFDRAIELDPKYAIAYSGRGCAKGWKGDQDGAIADFDRALELSPFNVEATFRFAEFLTRIERYDDALKLVDNYKKHDPQNPQIPVVLGQIQQLSQLARQEIELRQKLATTPGDLNLIMQFLSVLATRGKFPEMDGIIDQLIGHKEMPAQHFKTIAQTYVQLKRFDRVERVLGKYLAFHADDAQTWYDLAVVEVQLKRAEPAIDAIEKAIRLNPQFKQGAQQDQRLVLIKEFPRFLQLTR